MFSYYVITEMIILITENKYYWKFPIEIDITKFASIANLLKMVN